MPTTRLLQNHVKKYVLKASKYGRAGKQFTQNNNKNPATMDFVPSLRGNIYLMMVPGEGIEPSWYCYRRILSPVRLPISPPRQQAHCSTGKPMNTSVFNAYTIRRVSPVRIAIHAGLCPRIARFVHVECGIECGVRCGVIRRFRSLVLNAFPRARVRQQIHRRAQIVKCCMDINPAC